jgi:hypothetical protein
VSEERLSRLLLADVPQATSLVDAPGDEAVPVRGQTNRDDVAVVGDEIGGFSPRLQVPLATENRNRGSLSGLHTVTFSCRPSR